MFKSKWLSDWPDSCRTLTVTLNVGLASLLLFSYSSCFLFLLYFVGVLVQLSSRNGHKIDALLLLNHNIFSFKWKLYTFKMFGRWRKYARKTPIISKGTNLCNYIGDYPSSPFSYAEKFSLWACKLCQIHNFVAHITMKSFFQKGNIFFPLLTEWIHGCMIFFFKLIRWKAGIML